MVMMVWEVAGDLDGPDRVAGPAVPITRVPRNRAICPAREPALPAAPVADVCSRCCRRRARMRAARTMIPVAAVRPTVARRVGQMCDSRTKVTSRPPTISSRRRGRKTNTGDGSG
ncbi:hypothetical protein ACIBLB_27655 [Streptosporangium canum]|uniref:hypothetical protein n=1 Tax=Streptosporangium canum TaxID=324952 RepID=UPI0037B9503F